MNQILLKKRMKWIVSFSKETTIRVIIALQNKKSSEMEKNALEKKQGCNCIFTENDCDRRG